MKAFTLVSLLILLTYCTITITASTSDPQQLRGNEPHRNQHNEEDIRDLAASSSLVSETTITVATENRGGTGSQSRSVITVPTRVIRTKAPTKAPTTSRSTTRRPSTRRPSTRRPSTRRPSTRRPTRRPTTRSPTTKAPTGTRLSTGRPTTKAPTQPTTLKTCPTSISWQYQQFQNGLIIPCDKDIDCIGWAQDEEGCCLHPQCICGPKGATIGSPSVTCLKF